MANVTIRNIPDTILDQIKTLSALERRSMNSQILVLLEQAIGIHRDGTGRDSVRPLSPVLQAEMWERLAGTWEDERSAEQIIDDIYTSRGSRMDGSRSPS